MHQVIRTTLDRVLRVGPGPRQFSTDVATYTRFAAALGGGFLMLMIASLTLSVLT